MKIFIGNLPKGGQFKEEDVRRLFSQYGEAWDCVIGNKFGFIHMEEEAGNKAIKQLDGYKFEGRRMTVEKSISVRRSSSWESKSGEKGIKLEKYMKKESKKRFVSNIANETAVGDGNYYSRLGHADYQHNRCNSARYDGQHGFGDSVRDYNCNRLSGLCSRQYGFCGSMGNCSCNNLGRSKTGGHHNCNMLAGFNVPNDGSFNRMAGLCNTVGDRDCNKPGGSGNSLHEFVKIVGNDVYNIQGGCGISVYGCDCKNTVNDYNSTRMSAFRNTVGDNSYERMGRIVVKKEKIEQLSKTIKTEERKPLVNERLVNDLRNQVNYLERKTEKLEKEKAEFQLRGQVENLRKRVRDLQEEKKVYMDQKLNDDHGGRRSSKANINKRVKPLTPESSSTRGCFMEPQQESKTKRKNETRYVLDDEIHVIDASDDEEDLIIVDEGEDEVKILFESNIFRNRRDTTVSYISKNEDKNVENLSENGSKTRSNLAKDSPKKRMPFKKFVEEGNWGAVKSEKWNDGDIQLICLEDEDTEDIKYITEGKDDEQANLVNESLLRNSTSKDDNTIENMSEELEDVLNEGDDENLYHVVGVPPLSQVLGVPPPPKK